MPRFLRRHASLYLPGHLLAMHLSKVRLTAPVEAVSLASINADVQSKPPVQLSSAVHLKESCPTLWMHS